MTSNQRSVNQNSPKRSEKRANDRYPEEVVVGGEGLCAPARDQREQSWAQIPGWIDAIAAVEAKRSADH